jgi:hypothetical protein
MKHLDKIVWTAPTFFTLVACASEKHTNTGYSGKKLQKVDSLPMTMIKRQIDVAYSTVYIDTSSVINTKSPYFFSSLTYPKTSESFGFEHEKYKLFQFHELTYANFKELKFAIDDYGNINYLDQDF